MDDTRLISAVLNGEREQFTALVDKYKKTVYSIAWSHFGDSELSEDAAQEAFIKAYTNLRALRNPEHFHFWLIRITQNICRSFLRTITRDRKFIKQDPLSENHVGIPSTNKETLDEPLWECFSDLPQSYREVLTIFYLEEKDIRESATILGISETAMKTRLHRARIALRKQLDAKLEDTLEGLRPSDRFTRKVMGALPIIPGGMLKLSGAVGLLSKITATLGFMFWLAFGQILINTALLKWLSKLEASGIRNSPSTSFQREIVQDDTKRNMIWYAGIFLIIPIAVLLHFDMAYMSKLITLCLFFPLIRIVRQVRVNASKATIGMLLFYCFILIPCIATAFFNMPVYVLSMGMLIGSSLSFFTRDQSALRKDNNIFLRCAKGGFDNRLFVEDDGNIEMSLSDQQLKAFAKFLGSIWLVRDYTLKNGEIYLTLPDINNQFSSLNVFKHSSQIILNRSGRCSSYISNNDEQALYRYIGSDCNLKDLVNDTCRGIQTALICFYQNDLIRAKTVLSANSNDVVFDMPVVTKNRRILLSLFIVLCVISVVLIINSYLLARNFDRNISAWKANPHHVWHDMSR